MTTTNRLTPFGVIDRYFYSGGDNGGPVLGWSGFHAQRIMELLTAEGYGLVSLTPNLDKEWLDDLPDGAAIRDSDGQVLTRDGDLWLEPGGSDLEPTVPVSLIWHPDWLT